MARSSFWEDFKAFLTQGNVVDLAVAVVIGGAFGKIITSLVEDIITPAILSPALTAINAKNLEALSYNGILYGKFLAAVLSFLVIALSIFILIRVLEGAKKKLQRQKALEEAEAAAAPDPQIVLLERIARAVESR